MRALVPIWRVLLDLSWLEFHDELSRMFFIATKLALFLVLWCVGLVLWRIIKLVFHLDRN